MNILPLVAWVAGASIVLLRRPALAPKSQYDAANAPVTAHGQHGLGGERGSGAPLRASSGMRCDCLNLDLASEQQRARLIGQPRREIRDLCEGPRYARFTAW